MKISAPTHPTWLPIHRRIALVGLLAGVLAAIALQLWWSDLVDATIPIFLFAIAVGLAGEAWHVQRVGEFTLRHWVFAKEFEAIRRVESPLRFQCLLVAFALLGILCFVAGAVLSWVMIAKHAA
jgi:hypothetical protein